MEVAGDSQRWVVPPGRALWVPGGCRHSIECIDRVDMRTIYVPSADWPAPWDRTLVLPVPRLLCELIDHAIGKAPLRAASPSDARLAGVVVDVLRAQEAMELELPWPCDARAVLVAEALWRAPGDEATIDELAEFAETSPRSLERAFRRDTGMALGRWRRQARLLAAVRLLAAGTSVTEVALEVGYASTSAFVAMFRRELGVTPGSMRRPE